MASINFLKRKAPIFNAEGIPARHINAEQQLRRLVMSCLLWESEFYVDGKTIADQIAEAVAAVKPEAAARIAFEARSEQHLRHVPLWIVRSMAALQTHRHLVADTLQAVIQRPDELTEFLAIYWKDGKVPLSGQVKKGLARAFVKFKAHALAKYNRDGAVKLRDVLFLSHAKPLDEEQAAVWKQLVDGTLPSPDTWEVSLSAGADKKETFERLIAERKLGGLATLRNLRNMHQSGVQKSIARAAIEQGNFSQVLPFRFIAAARAVPVWEDIIEPAMLRVAAGAGKLGGKTVLLVDTSPSMACLLSARSDLSRKDAAFGLAVLLREICTEVEIWAFSTECRQAPTRRGFALADAIRNAVPSNGTLLGNAIDKVAGRYDRLIVVTDEESQDPVGDPDKGKLAYMINVASNKNGVGYGRWVHVDGWSESVVKFIAELERTELNASGPLP